MTRKGQAEASGRPYPLVGVLVVDFTRVLAGPTCTRMLADAGARVIKIERAGSGDLTRELRPFVQDGSSEYFRFANLGKESIALDLKSPDDLALARRMIARADIVVENFRPGVMTRLGLDPEALVQEHPRLIVCSISGFGQSGPMSRKPAFDTVVQAVSGIMDATGWPDGSPTRVGTSISDIAAGIFGYCGIVTALAAREKTGRGTTIDIAMLDSTFALLEHGLMDALGTHERPHRLGNRHPAMYPFDTFTCSDGLLAIAVGTDQEFGALSDALGLSCLREDSKYITNAARCSNHVELKAAMEGVLRGETARFWRDRLDKAGVPAEVVLNVADTRQLDQIRQRQMVRIVDGFEVPGTPLKFGAYESIGTTIAAPRFDQHGAALREEFGAPSATGSR